jgi:tripartite-type tricarboxylate transporter receptor subunit TctC
VIEIVAREAQKALKDPVIVQRFEAYGLEPIGSSPAEFKATIDEDVGQWRKIIKDANIKL